ncbi:MAG TPA: D-alanyl-D-alanine carboxypeptidase/D-alanyl-D-alanine-endopeptidase [Pyrinomonadaceae bacterium]|nr:D-alanyl-D-alanine carboxypeptidase/D-alanyl-D-alanine-endopeptidase [Pyrinomonadaceae bacterium]
MALVKTRSSRFTSLLLIFSFVFASTSAPIAAQTTPAPTQRERRVKTPAPTPTPPPITAPTPRVLPTPTPTPARTNVVPVATPTPLVSQPTPTATPTPTPIAPAPRTLEELRARIREVLARPEFVSSHLAVKVASLDTGRVLFEENAEKWLQPASNLKLYTVAAALDRLSPDYRFTTSVYAAARPDPAGTVRGDLIVYGRGDPTYATRFGGDYFTAIDELAGKIVAAGVRRVEGDLVGDESYFTGEPFAPGWEWDDLQWWYGAEVSALSVDDNSVDLTVKPGARVGDPCVITVGPSTPLVTIVDRTTTTARGTRREIAVRRALTQNVIEISGGMSIDDRGQSMSVAISRPAMLFATMLRTSLERQGVQFTGRTRTVSARERESAPLQVSTLVELAVRQSPPLSVISAQTLKPSQNLYTELLLRTLGKVTSTDARKTSEEAGIEAVRAFVRAAGMDAEKLLMFDGSGLSRGNLVTAASTLDLLIYMNRHRYSAAFREALPVAGVDGTLRNRMKGTPAQGNARAKTGTLSSATSLSGYVLSAAGERLVFSLMINNPPRAGASPTSFTDAVTVLLASFAGRS